MQPPRVSLTLACIVACMLQTIVDLVCLQKNPRQQQQQRQTPLLQSGRMHVHAAPPPPPAAMLTARRGTCSNSGAQHCRLVVT